MAVSLCVVDAISDDEPLTQLEPDVFGRDRDRPPLALVDQDAQPDRTGAAGLKLVNQRPHAESRIQNVFNDENIGPGNVGYGYV